MTRAAQLADYTSGIGSLPISYNTEKSAIGFGTGNPTSTVQVGNNIFLGEAGIVTATGFVGVFTGNVTGNSTGLSGEPSIVVDAATVNDGIIVHGFNTELDTINTYTKSNYIGVGWSSITADVDGAGLLVYGLSNRTLTYNLNRNAFETNVAFAATDLRITNRAEKLIRVVTGTGVTISYGGTTGNIGFATGPTGDISVEVRDIPTGTDFNNFTIPFKVIVHQTGTARTCTAVSLNGVSRPIHWRNGGLNSNLGPTLTTSIGYTVFDFVGINTVGNASTMTNYIVFGEVSGYYKAITGA